MEKKIKRVTDKLRNGIKEVVPSYTKTFVQYYMPTSQIASSSSSFSYNQNCPTGYQYNPQLGLCVSQNNASVNDSLENLTQSEKHCIQYGGTWVDGICLSSSSSYVASQSSSIGVSNNSSKSLGTVEDF